MNDVSLYWFAALFEQQRTGDFAGALIRSIILALIVIVLTVVFSIMAGMAFRNASRDRLSIFYMAVASLIMPGLFLSLGIGLVLSGPRHPDQLVHLGARCAAHLDAAFRLADHVRRTQPLQQGL